MTYTNLAHKQAPDFGLQTLQASKIAEDVTFPETLDVRDSLDSQESSWKEGETTFELFGVVYHKGSSMEEGHYGKQLLYSQPRACKAKFKTWIKTLLKTWNVAGRD